MKKENQTIDDLIQKFCSYLRGIERSEATIKEYLRTWRRVKSFMALNQFQFYDKSIGEKYLQSILGQWDYTQLKYRDQFIVNKVEALHEFQETGLIVCARRNSAKQFPGVIGNAMLAYINYKKNTFNVATSTVDGYLLYLHDLLLFLNNKGINEFSDITPADLISFIETLDTQKLATMHATINTNKAFLHYLYTIRLIPEDFSKLLPKVNYKKSARLPSNYSIDEVRSLLKSIDRANPRGKRDYAMLLLAVKLGMRSSDISLLKFENIQWENNLLVLTQKKTGNPITFPLLPEIGNAIIDYLKHGRPKSDESYCFLKLRAPYTKLDRHDMWSLVQYQLSRSGINLSNRKHGGHALRHSYAGNLLEQKIPLPIISEALGHKKTESTMTYLRIDINTLKQCALNVPELPSTFYKGIGGLNNA